MIPRGWVFATRAWRGWSFLRLLWHPFGQRPEKKPGEKRQGPNEGKAKQWLEFFGFEW